MISANNKDPQNPPAIPPNNLILTEDEQLDILFSRLTKENPDNSLPSLIEMVKSEEKAKQLYGVTHLHKLLRSPKGSAIQGLIDAGGVAPLIRLMQFSTVQKIQYEAVRAVTNLCLGTTEQTLYVLNNGAMGSFVALLNSLNEDIMKTTLFSLQSIDVNVGEIRDLVLQYGTIEALVGLLGESYSVSVRRQVMEFLSNFCRREPEPSYELISKVVPVFCDCLKSEEKDERILIAAVWGLFYISGAKETGDAIIERDMNLHFIRLLGSENETMVEGCLGVVKSIVERSGILQEKKFVEVLCGLADDPTRKEVFEIVSRVSALDHLQMEVIMRNPDFVRKIIKTAKEAQFEVKREAILALVDYTKVCTPAQAIGILESGVYLCLAEVACEMQEEDVLLKILEGIENCLRWGREYNVNDDSGQNRFAVQFQDKLPGLDYLLDYDGEAKEKLKTLLADYFPTYERPYEEDEEEDV